MADLGREYPWRRTDAWDWFGTARWWEVGVVVHGFNGCGGAVVTELWRWNGDCEVLREEQRNLSLGETRALLAATEVRDAE